jgi:hypothetical protein
MLTRIKLKDGELSIPQQVEERIREECGVSKESFYGSAGAAQEHDFQHGNRGLDLTSCARSPPPLGGG